jgi:hypothetical protein
LFLCFGKAVQGKVNAPAFKENITELIRDEVIGKALMADYFGCAGKLAYS